MTTRPATVGLGDPRDGFAVWPEDNSTDAEVAVSGDVPEWRLAPASTARGFAVHVLGWRRVDVELGAGGVVEVRDRDGSGAVELTMLRVAEPLWSVVSARGVGPFDGYGPAFSIRGGVVEMLGLEAEHGAVAVEVYAHFGPLDGFDVADDDGAVTIRLGASPQLAGHVLILWRDGDGDVISAFATAAPAGDSAAG